MWNYAWNEIARRKGRSIATILSYSLAVAIFAILISLFQYSERSMHHAFTTCSCCNPASSPDPHRKLMRMMAFLVTIFIFAHVIQNTYASIAGRRHEIGILHSMGWSRKKIIALLGWELTLETAIGCFLGYNVAVVCQILIPIQLSSHHLLCAIDLLKISLIGIAITVIAAIGSGLIIAWFVTAALPAKNLRSA